MRNGFRLIVEIDGAEIEAVNRKLKALGDVRAANAMRNGFRKWTKRVATIAKAMIPQGKAAPTEKVRGEVRPNPHIRDFVTTKVVGYSRGKVIWAAVGVKELRGSYATPHWYLRWVELGHDLKRAATDEERIRLVTRGERRRKTMTVKVGEVAGRFYLRRAGIAAEPYLLPIMEQAIADQVLKDWAA